MSEDPRIQLLLDELLDSDANPDQVCTSYPELLPLVRERWRELCDLQADLDEMFPSSNVDVPQSPDWSVLPKIPGYEVDSVLGRGGMGIVFRARQLRLNRPVALKMLLAGAYSHLREEDRFQREAEAVAELRHPNVVQIFDIGDVNGQPYFTMEFIDGGNLSENLAGTPQPGTQAAQMLSTLAKAVHTAHSCGIVHRDLKPTNVLLSKDGILKISDFGLAHRLNDVTSLTQTGLTVGTPSYMSPEQALGRPDGAGPAVDIYALGAILYELLTGRAPFRAATAAETVQQVISQEPAPPSRINNKVPRDLETICLKCLQKDPGRRYATAADLADDLGRFQRNEPISARPAGLPERVAKWVRRHPAGAAVFLVSLVLAIVLVSVGYWLAAQQASRSTNVEADLIEMASLQDSARWSEAQSVLARADARLEGGGSTDLRRRIEQARHDLDLVIQLDEIRLKRLTQGKLKLFKTQASRSYSKVFQQAGVGTIRDEPLRVANRIKASAAHAALVSAVYDWLICTSSGEEQTWLLAVAREVKPDPDGWRQTVFDPVVWENKQRLTDLFLTAPLARQPLALLLALAERPPTEAGTSFLRRLQRENPADFWVNLVLGNTLLQKAPQEAAGFYRAALASRPRAAVGYCAVGDSLRLQQDLEAAIEYYEKAIELDPKYARAQNNLGLIMQSMGRTREAIEFHRKAIEFDPDYIWAHFDLGTALRGIGRLDEACSHFREAVEREPENIDMLNGLRSVQVREGRGREVQADWQKLLQADSPPYAAWTGYAELCLFLGQTEDYRQARRDLLSRFGRNKNANIAEMTVRACALLPGTSDEMKKVSALATHLDNKKSSEPSRYPYIRFAVGHSEYRLGHWSNSISIMESDAAEVMGPCPRLITAMAQYQSGQVAVARKTLASAVLAYDWNAVLADHRDAWTCHILRREAEMLLLPELPKFLAGEYQPQDNDEQMAMIGICQFQGLHRKAARLYADGFANSPQLADIPGCRYRAACCAAQVGCGKSEESAGLDVAERAQWRRQAWKWLQADLLNRVGQLHGIPDTQKNVIRTELAQWREDIKLSCVRDSDELNKLSEDERKDFGALWTGVAAALAKTEK